MNQVLTPAQMRVADEACIEAGTPSETLMRRAAHACAVTVLRMLGGGYGKRVVVVAGKGNNGGDGEICAEILSSKGVGVTVVRTTAWSDDAFSRVSHNADLVIDAVLGTGFRDAPSGDVSRAIAAINASGRRVFAIDIPSGVNGADGSAPGVAVRADVTLAIQALKVGHVVMPGSSLCGRIDLADIGIPVHDCAAFLPTARDVRGVLPDIEPDTHKYRVGALGIVAGSHGMSGAAILAARAAIRAGAGLVMLGVASSSLSVFEDAVTEAIKVPLPESEGQLDAKSVDEFADRLQKCRALAIGPGIGRGPRAVSLVRRALDVDLPLLIDGDGLWGLAEVMKEEPDVLASRNAPSVLTPHTGEFTFLTGREPAVDRVSDVRDRAAEWGAVVHLKGRRAITASPSGLVWVNPTGNPGAATAGSGDVLTGITSSLMAQGMMPDGAMWAGAFIHGMAADIGANRIGQRSLQAGDIAEDVARALVVIGRATQDTAKLRTVMSA